jgi:hypothetical protein
MSNHYHLVLYVNLEMANKWSDEEVITTLDGIIWRQHGEKYRKIKSCGKSPRKVDGTAIQIIELKLVYALL